MKYWEFKKGIKSYRGKVKSDKNVLDKWKEIARKYNDVDEIEF